MGPLLILIGMVVHVDYEKGGKMKRIILMIISFMCLASLTFGATINLKATWLQNTEPDMASYRLYRTDTPTRTLVGTITHPPALPYAFVISVADGSTGTLKFVLTAVDTGGNESGDSTVVQYPFDFLAPAVPGGLSIIRVP
jgi:hypothetical protein